MLVSPKHKLIFIHIPKTGGTSIRDALRRSDDSAYAYGMWHFTAMVCKGLMPEWDEYQSFAVVRNPWDRVVSAYAYIGHKNQSFDEFVRSRGWSAEYLRPQLDWLIDGHGDRIVNTVCRYERLKYDFDELCPGVELKHLNTSERGHYRDYFTRANERHIEKLFARDIEAFGYTF